MKIKCATADVNPPEQELEPIFDDRSGRRRVTGPIALCHRRQDRDRLGNRRRARAAECAPQCRVRPREAPLVPGRHHPHLQARPDARRLEQRRQPEQQPGPVPVLGDRSARRRGRSSSPGMSARSSAIPASCGALRPRSMPSSATGEPPFRSGRRRTTRSRRSGSSIPEGSSQLVLEDRDHPRETHMLERGDFLKPRKVVGPGTPSFLNPLPAEQPANRLTFARWLVDRQAPTTARSIVNRIWQAYFGTGIVSTSEDLGSQCEAPSHPELLDWLAVELMDSGWSLKHLHRLIVALGHLSPVVPGHAGTARRKTPTTGCWHAVRGSAWTPRSFATSRWPPAACSIAGWAAQSVQPPAPAFLFQPPASYGPKAWIEATGPDRYRRALYTFRYRSIPYPMLQVFDAPNGDFSCVRRAPVEHPPPGPHPAQRADLPRMRPGPGPAVAQGRRPHRCRPPDLRLPPLSGPRSPRTLRPRRCWPCWAARPAILHRDPEPLGPGRRQARGGPPPAAHRNSGPARRLDGGRPRPAQPR